MFCVMNNFLNNLAPNFPHFMQRIRDLEDKTDIQKRQIKDLEEKVCIKLLCYNLLVLPIWPLYFLLGCCVWHRQA